MRHARYRHAVLKGELTPEIKAHVNSCAACARLADAIAAVRAELLAPPPPAAPLVQQVLERTRARHAARPSYGALGAAVMGGAGPSTMRFARALVIVAAVAATAALACMLRPVTESQAVTPVPFTSVCKRDGALWVAGVWNRRERDAFRGVLQLFERSTGVRVRFAYATHDIARTLDARLEQHCPPDVALLPQPGLMRQLARDGHLKPIDDVAGGLVRRNYTDFWRKLGTVGSTLYGVWFKAADKSTIWFNPAAFRRVHAPPPQTWRQLTRVAESLQESGIAPFSIGGKDGWTLTDWFENVYLRATGPVLYDKLTKHETPWTDPSVKRALGLLSQLFGARGFVAGGRSGALRTGYHESVRQVFDRSPKAAMVYEGDFVRSEQLNFATSVTPGVFEFPVIGRSRRTRVVGGDVAVMLKDNGDARRLMRFLATPAAAKPWARAGGFVSPNINVPLGAYAVADNRRTATALRQSETIRFDLSDEQRPAFGATAGKGMWKIFRYFLEHPHAIDEVAQRLEAAAKRYA